MKTAQKNKFLFITGGLLFLILVLIDFFRLSTGTQYQEIPHLILIKKILLVVIMYCTIFFYRNTILYLEKFNFSSLLWKAAATGFIVLLFVTGFDVVTTYFPSKTIKLLANHVLVVGAIMLSVSNYYVSKRLLSYQKSRTEANIFALFDSAILVLPLITLSNLTKYDYLFHLILVPFLLAGFYLSLQLQWLNYLNFRQKLASLFTLIILLAESCFVYLYLLNFEAEELFFIYISNNIFFTVLFVFGLISYLINILILIFNLPTSSFFEKKFKEIQQFQKLSDVFLSELDEKKIFKLILENAHATLAARKSFIIHGDNENAPYYFDTDHDEINTLYKYILTDKKLYQNEDYYYLDDLSKKSYYENIRQIGQLSCLMFPLRVNNEFVGFLVLLSDAKNAFERDMIDLVNTYKNQACLSIGNKRLLDKAVDQAIYAKEIEIAKKVKSVLIPQNIPQFDEIDLAYYSSSADDVGGDYFDISKRNGHINIVLADISGKGTAASFNMAEFKGVFQSLNMFELTLNNFICLANDILYKTLEKNSFITAIFLRVDTKGRTIKVARAGHCPLLLYRKKDHEVFVIQQSGLGLAITEGKKFADMLAEVEFEFSEGDLIFSYTDGLTDQKRNEIDFFDTSFLKEFIKQHAHLPVSEFRAILAKLLIDTKVYNTVTDDMSFIVGKLK